MVNTKQYIVQDGQNIYDVCVNTFGSVDALLDLFLLNPELDLLPLYPGQIIYYIPKVVNANVLKVYNESSYVPATSSEMSQAPVPPPAPPADGVVISQFGLPDVTISAPGEFEVAPSRVEDGEGNILETLSPGQVYIDPVESVTINLFGVPAVTVNAPGTYTVQPSTVKKNGVTIDTLSPGEEYIIQPDSVTITYPNNQQEVIEAPGIFEVPVSKVRKNGVTVASLSPGEEYTIQPDSVTITYPNNQQQEIEAPGSFAVPPAKVLNAQGNLVQDLSPGDTYQLANQAQVAYQRIRPTQRTSYRIGDIGWHVQNGTFEYIDDPINFQYRAELDFTAGANSFYRLKNNNVFGNKNRFTTSIGTPASDGNATFVLADFNGAINGYVIDHLTGLGYDILSNVNFAGNWIGAVDFGVNSVFGGFSDWYMIGVEHLFSVVNLLVSPYATGNLFRYADIEGNPGTAYNFTWTATTPAGVTTSAIMLRHTSMILEVASKTGFTFVGAIFARNHY